MDPNVYAFIYSAVIGSPNKLQQSLEMTSRTLCRSTNGNPPILQRCLSTSVKEHIEPTFHHPSIENSALGDFRTCENNPVHHTTQHAGQFYTILPEIKVQLFQNGGFPKLFEKQIKTFGETLANWTRRPREVSSSTTREGFVDLPLDAATWLVHFKSQNSALLNKLDLRISKDYIWSKRETTREGSSILELVEHGINRVKYASDCIIALLKEIKTHSTHGR
ncbi:unnamed protein product, partial [Timema podura]|nr:unnamed protein product [Timema podura]